MKTYQSISEIQADLNSGITTIPSLVEYYLGRIEQHKNLNAFLEVFDEEARSRAEEVQQKVVNKTAGKLAGMVIGLKDNICFKGHKVSASSKILEGFESLYSSTAVSRLLAEDAIVIGRLNCDEFAMGSSNENSAFGPVKNPVNIKTVPGGSSGGSAAAVAADLCMVALGSDTGGSIRQPASFTGIIGMKPTYGRVSRHGLLAYASSFDQIGPFSKSIDDAALVLDVISGKDEYDSTSSKKPVQKSFGLKEERLKKIVYIKECLEREGINEEVKSRFISIVEELRNAGHEVAGVNFPYLDQMVPTYYVLTTAEASSNLSRYDGIHFGFRSEKAAGVEETYKKSRSEGFGLEVKRRIMLGTFVLSAGYYDAYYAKAQKVRRLIQNETREMLKSADFILTPTTPDSAFEFGANADNPIKMYLQDIFTVQANLAGGPAISLPLGKKKDGMPFGIQVMASDFQEAEMMSFSNYLMSKFQD